MFGRVVNGLLCNPGSVAVPFWPTPIYPADSKLHFVVANQLWTDDHINLGDSAAERAPKIGVSLFAQPR